MKTKHLKLFFLVYLTVLFLFWTFIIVFAHFFYGGAISDKTEAKYLRNVPLSYPINDHQFYFPHHSDTLSFIAEVSFSYANPFVKWYINDVGYILRSSQLSNKLDSMMRTYKKPPNRLK